MSHAARILALAIALGGATACTNGVVPGTAYDQPIFSFSGIISPRGGLVQAGPQQPRVGLLWTDPLQRTPDVPMPAGWYRSSVNASHDPMIEDTFTVDVFRPPPPEAIVDFIAPSQQVFRLAIAELVIFDAQTPDGTFRLAVTQTADGAPQGNPRATIAAPEIYLAGSANVLTYAVGPIPSSVRFPLTVPDVTGYALVDYGCSGRVSSGVTMVSRQAVNMILQPSSNLPDVRTCLASHGP